MGPFFNSRSGRKICAGQAFYRRLVIFALACHNLAFAGVSNIESESLDGGNHDQHNQDPEG
jgi:hypothetical protein